MQLITNYTLPFEEYIDSIAVEALTDQMYELGYQGLHISDKCRYLLSIGCNVKPQAQLNGVFI